MSRLSVAVIVTRLQAGAGGVALRGALALDPLRYAATIIAGDCGGSDSDGSGDSMLVSARNAGLSVIGVPGLVSEISPANDARALRLITGLLADGGYDVVHTHSAKAGALGRLAAERTRTPRVVHTFHGFPFHEFQSSPRRAVYVGIERYLGRRTDCFLAVGGSVAAEAIRRGIAASERVRVISPAIDFPDVPVSPATRNAARRRLGIPVGCKAVGTVGRVDYQKAPECFVDAIAGLGRPDVYAVWIGDGPGRSEMEKLARRRGLQGRFTCTGHRDDVPDLLPGLDVFAMASRYEGLPCAVAEAMTAGVPVVATAVNAVPDVVLPGETGLLACPQRPRQLAAAIAYMLDEPGEAARMAAAAYRLIAGRFTPQSLAAVLDAAYAGPDSSPVRPIPRAVPRPA
ncbi:MAG TPA: glycosyltransferase [Streptosporangiaceae bacterium]|nr:glycosyltransferase [Streptosporangiaceae bacterium]